MGIKSYTLIELLIVIGILSVVSAATIPSFVNYSQEKNIDRVATSVVSDIKLVRNKAFAGAFESAGTNSDFWTLSADCQGAAVTDRKEYRLGYTPTAGAFVSKSVKLLPGNFSFTNSSGGNCGAYNDLSFERLTGKLRSGNLQSIYISGNGARRRIDIYRSGAINVITP